MIFHHPTVRSLIGAVYVDVRDTNPKLERYYSVDVGLLDLEICSFMTS